MRSFLFFTLLAVFFLSCSNGNDSSKGACEGTNPCAGSLVPHKTICIPQGETFTCGCQEGYQETERGTCEVKHVSEVCKNHVCSEENTECDEYNGSPICVCKDGYTLSNGKCIGTDPCKNAPCKEANRSICSKVNNDDYICYCDDDYYLVNDTCKPVTYGNYYNSLDMDLRDEALIEALHQIIKDHHAIGYNSAGNKLNYIDGDYCSYTGLTNLGLNTEHVWPQSYFGGGSPMVSDLHHLRNVSSYVNSKRGNIHFGDVEKTDCNPDCYKTCTNDGDTCAAAGNCCWYCDWDGTIYKNGSATQATEAKKGKPGTSCSAHSVFEPYDAIKGDVARALFYFAVRYKHDQINQSQAYGTGPHPKNHIPLYEESTLRKWHKQDPVSPEEFERNNRIQDIQHNRNPFIDRPELVDRISDF